MNKKRVGKQRLAIDIPQIVHQILKEIALAQRTTVTNYVLGAIKTKLELELSHFKENLGE